jgi:hypothetical protein
MPPPPPPVKLPVAPVAPGSSGVSTLSPPGLAIRLHADYDRTGTLNATEAEHLVRLLRPGAILLANLDISDLTRIPTPAPADLAPMLDGLDSDINGAADQAQMTPARFDAPSPVPSRAATVLIRLDAADAPRVRMFLNFGGGSLQFTPFGDASITEFPVKDIDGLLSMDDDFLIEATTLPGDPKLPASIGASPDKPQPVPKGAKTGPFSAKLPTGSKGAPIVAKRAPADVWVELVHQDGGSADLKSPHEVALFTIAPFLLLCGFLPAKQVFVVNAPDVTLPGGVFWLGNHNFIFDLMEGCQAAFGAASVPLPPDPSSPFTPSTPATNGPFYLIDGAKADPTGFGLADPWIQDEMEIGYCFAPHASMHVVLHLKRNRGLDKIVHSELPAIGLGLYDSLHAPNAHSDAVHYGGNLEGTPPITAATPALAAGAAGPAIKAHRPAPFGKILLGDSADRPVDADYRDFLLAQRVQPAIPVDTSWLMVGHVDEFTSFVADSSAKGFKLLFGSVKAMTDLLNEVKKVPVSSGRTNFHRGKFVIDLSQDALGNLIKIPKYDEISVEDLLTNTKPFNDQLRTEKLIPIDQRLKAGLNLAESDIIRIPTYFTPPAVASPTLSPTVAQTMGMVNMLVVGGHLMIPKPLGPRMSPSDATAVLKRTFAKTGNTAPVKLPATDDTRWVENGELPERMVCYYTDAPTDADRQNIIDHINDPANALSADNLLRVAAQATAIAAANSANATLQAQLVPAITGGPFTAWMRITIPDGKVDVLEAYMLSVLSPLGVTIHFVDDWYYHFQLGEAHCATNAVREMPEVKSSKRWWDKYDPTMDETYSP